ncbi:MAG: class I SAM-dependent methyltransferase [Turicibacter sp.]
MDSYKSKGWNWEVMQEIFWRQPAEETYFLRLRWEKLGFEEFLDLGCGVGRHSLFFAEDGYTVTSFDLSNSGLIELSKKADELGLEIELECGDMLNIPFENNKFDCILAYHSIYHTDFIGLKSVINKLYDLLVDGGECYITLNSKENSSYKEITNTVLDEHTIIKNEGHEAGILHTYVDQNDIAKLTSPFKIISLKHVQDFYDNQSTYHYHLLLKK